MKIKIRTNASTANVYIQMTNNDPLQVSDSTRVKRQAQSVLSLLSQNPSLVQQLQQNPEFIQLLQAQLQQQQQFSSLPTPLSVVGNIPLVSSEAIYIQKLYFQGAKSFFVTSFSQTKIFRTHFPNL